MLPNPMFLTRSLPLSRLRPSRHRRHPRAGVGHHGGRVAEQLAHHGAAVAPGQRRFELCDTHGVALELVDLARQARLAKPLAEAVGFHLGEHATGDLEGLSVLRWIGGGILSPMDGDRPQRPREPEPCTDADARGGVQLVLAEAVRREERHACRPQAESCKLQISPGARQPKLQS